MAKKNFHKKQITEKEFDDALKRVKNYLESADVTDKAFTKQAQLAQRVIKQFARQREKQVAELSKAAKRK